MRLPQSRCRNDRPALQFVLSRALGFRAFRVSGARQPQKGPLRFRSNFLYSGDDVFVATSRGFEAGPEPNPNTPSRQPEPSYPENPRPVIKEYTLKYRGLNILI